jgi:transposase
MLYAGLDLSRKRVDFHLLGGEGATLEVGAAPPDADGLDRLTERLARHGAPIRAAIESMNGARFVHDRLELAGWQVDIADAQKVKGLAPLACKTERIDAWVLAELARRDLVPAIWLPDPRVRAERERARWRLHLVRDRSSLKQRCTRCCSPTASLARSPTSSASAAASSSPGWVCRSRGRARSRRACG